jgi:hypothetical protein
MRRRGTRATTTSTHQHHLSPCPSSAAIAPEQHSKGRRSMPHFPSLLVGCLTSGTVFLAVHQQLSHRRRLSEKWALQGIYTNASSTIAQKDDRFCISLNFLSLFIHSTELVEEKFRSFTAQTSSSLPVGAQQVRW